MRTTVVTVTYNSADVLTRYWRRNPDIDWIVVDNASSDDTVEVAKKLGASVVSLPVNVGFARANNIGAQKAGSDFLVFANPDVSLTTEGLGRMEQLLIEKDAVFAPQLINPDGTLQANGRNFPYLDYKIAHMLGRPKRWRAKYQQYAEDGLRPVRWVMGAAVAVRRKTFEEIGGWNEAFFLYYEDAEFCLRAWSASRPVYVDASTKWVHGWGRETKSFNASAWRREIRSAMTFYTLYPEFVRLRPLRRSLRRASPLTSGGPGGI